VYDIPHEYFEDRQFQPLATACHVQKDLSLLIVQGCKLQALLVIARGCGKGVKNSLYLMISLGFECFGIDHCCYSEQAPSDRHVQVRKFRAGLKIQIKG
jgi:hypothetical protein